MENLDQEVALVDKKKRASKTWLLLDTYGNTISLEVDKYAIMQRAGIHARDLRILDPLLFYPSAILGRERAIVLNLEVRIFILLYLKCRALGQKLLMFTEDDRSHVFVSDFCFLHIFKCEALPLRKGKKQMEFNHALVDVCEK